jgi:hypothetical protein
MAVWENPSDGRLVAEVQHSSDDVSPLDIVRATYYREYEVGERDATLATPHLRLGSVPGSSRFLFHGTMVRKRKPLLCLRSRL